VTQECSFVSRAADEHKISHNHSGSMYLILKDWCCMCGGERNTPFQTGSKGMGMADNGEFTKASLPCANALAED